jgi:hypothetical protein
MTVLAALLAGLACFFAILGEIAATVLAALAIHGLAIAMTGLAAFLAGLGSTLAIFGKIAGAAAMFGCHSMLL